MPDYSRGLSHPPPRWTLLRRAAVHPESHSSGPVSHRPSCGNSCRNDGAHYDVCAGIPRCRISCPSYHTRFHPRIPDSGPILLSCQCNSSVKFYGTKLTFSSRLCKSGMTIFSFSDENIFSFLCSGKLKYFLRHIK